MPGNGTRSPKAEASPFAEMRNDCFRKQHWRSHVNVHHGLIVIHVDVGDRSSMADGRAVDEDIESTERRDGFAHRAHDSLRGGAVGLDGDCATPCALDGFGHRFSFFGRALVRERDVSTVLCQRQRDRGSDAPASSSNHCTLPIKIDHMFVLFYHVGSSAQAIGVRRGRRSKA